MTFRLVPQRDRKLNRLFKAGAEVWVNGGASLFRPDEEPKDVFLIHEGHVRLWIPARDGRRVVGIAGPRDVLALDAASGGRAASHTCGAVAASKVRAVTVPGAKAAQALRTASKSFAAFVRALTSELGQARRWGPGRVGPTTEERLAEVLLGLLDRFGVDQGEATRLPLRLTHQDLADLAGAHRSTATTLLNDWIYRDLVEDTAGGLTVRRDALAAQIQERGGGT